MQNEDQNQEVQDNQNQEVQDNQEQQAPETTQAAPQEEVRARGNRKVKEKEKGDSLTPKEARKYVTTSKVKSRGRLRHPITQVVYSQNSPKLGEGGPFSWIEAQVQAGLMEEYK